MPNELEALTSTILGDKKPDAAAAAAAAGSGAGTGAAEGATPDDVEALFKDMVELDMGEGNKRQLTKKQIANMVKSYGETAGELDEHGPILDLVKEIKKAVPDATPQQIAQFLAQAAQGHKPADKKEGEGAPATNKPTALPNDDDLTKWEKENATTLPPGYREIGTLIQQMTAAMGGQQQMLAKVLEASSGAAAAAGKLSNEAVETKNVNAREKIGLNLDKAQTALQLGDDDAQPFMAYALDRGYVAEDFSRFDLTLKVMTDYKAVKAQPEFERLKKIAERRQAFSGSLGAQAGGGGPAKAPDDAADTFNNLVNQQMKKL